MTESPEPCYTLALEEARRGFDQLATEVSDVRNRAASLLGMGGLAASLLAGLTLRNEETLTGWAWLAVAAFVVLAVLCALVFWRRRFHVSQHPSVLVQWAEHHGASQPEMERDLALWLGKKYDENRVSVDRAGPTPQRRHRRVPHRDRCPPPGPGEGVNQMADEDNAPPPPPPPPEPRLPDPGRGRESRNDPRQPSTPRPSRPGPPERKR